MTQTPIPFRGMTPDGLAIYGEDPAPGYRIPPPPEDLAHSCPCGLGDKPCPGPDGRPLCAPEGEP